jgi:hypothetical protein
MIPLQNLAGKHLGVLLTAGLPKDFLSCEGRWEGDCIFFALPTERGLFDDPVFCVLADHKDAGEHHIEVTNDGTTLSLLATAPTGQHFFVRLPNPGPGTWGERINGIDTPMGLAVRVSNLKT